MKIAVGMSGGVDSSVSAYLLKQAGYDVIGVYMKIWDDGTMYCTSAQDAADARYIASQIDIPFIVLDMSQAYKERVFTKFIDYHNRKITPSPDLWCNEYIKFEALWDALKPLQIDMLATGHYAKIEDNKLCIPYDKDKDQTYFLARMNKDMLSKTLFPLADMDKQQVRHIAADNGLITATKKDSTGICFIGERPYRAFLEEYIPPQEHGKILCYTDNKEIGMHTGLTFYTIGQRKNIGLAGAIKGYNEAPWYVIHKDRDDNILYVSQNEDDLLASTMPIDTVKWIVDTPQYNDIQVKIRYRTHAINCKIDGNVVYFDTPARAITQGQYAVFYDNRYVLGSAEIM